LKFARHEATAQSELSVLFAARKFDCFAESVIGRKFFRASVAGNDGPENSRLGCLTIESELHAGGPKAAACSEVPSGEFDDVLITVGRIDGDGAGDSPVEPCRKVRAIIGKRSRRTALRTCEGFDLAGVDA
jgi:hypothetical protein